MAIEWDVANRPGDLRVNHDGEWAIGEGVFLLALGAISLGTALIGGKLAYFALPFLLLLRAVDEFISAFEGTPFGGVWHVVLAGTSMLAAVIVLGEPGPIGPVAFWIFPGGYFLVDGVFRLVAAYKMRQRSRWTWLLASGVLSVALGVLGLRTDAVSTVCAMLGVAALLSGGAVMSRGFVFRRAEQRLALSR